MNREEEARMANRNRQLILGMMLADLKDMRHQRVTWGVNRKKNKPLSEEELPFLEEIISLLQKALVAIAQAPVGEIVSVSMASICTCPIHLKYFEKIRLETLDDLDRMDPMALLDWLHEAELQEGAKRQYHLYTRMHFKAEELAKKHTGKS